jgi:hypothetical protein
VLNALLTTTGVITAWVGAESQKDEQELEQARRIARDLPRGSLERRFFEQLAQRIEVRLSWIVDRPRPACRRCPKTPRHARRCDQ